MKQKKKPLLNDNNKTGAAKNKMRPYLLRLLAKRDYTYHELSTKLRARGYLDDDIKTLLDAFTEMGYIDDARYATHYAATRAKQVFGPKRIVMELKCKGINESIIASITKITHNDWLTDMQMLLKKRVKSKSITDAKEKAKIVRFFLNRGFTQTQIFSLLKTHRDWSFNNDYETETE